MIAGPVACGERRLYQLVLAGILTILAVKAWLTTRINVNWDEFYILSQVHGLVRGELHSSLQTALTRALTWVTLLHGGEVTQVNAARLAAWVLLAFTCLMIYRLGRHHASPLAASGGVLAYLASYPVLRHGASLRADSVLVLLTMLAIWLLTVRPRSDRAAVAAGVFMGLAMVVTIKSVLLAPVLLALVLTAALADQPGPRLAASRTAKGLVLVAGVGLVTTVLLMLLHAHSLGSDDGSFVPRMSHAATKTLLENPLFPRLEYLQRTLVMDTWTWGLIVAGLLVALGRRQWAVASLALALTPVVYYRNSFPYFYVVMLAPACVLAGIAIDALGQWLLPQARPALVRTLVALLMAALAAQAYGHIRVLRRDEQFWQRVIIAAVHEIFPTPVAYIDHSGMIASYPKANFFMTTLGVESYLASGRDFMPEAFARFQPPLLLENRSELVPGSRPFKQLRATDRTFIERFYVAYWGPIKVAGATARLQPRETVTIALPFAGRFRLSAPSPVVVNGTSLAPGDVLEVKAGGLDLALSLEDPASVPIDASLVWADARPAPDLAPPSGYLYQGL